MFRLEAEHLHNTEGFRRVEVIPLHFDRKPARDDEGDEKRTLGQQLGVAAELASYAGVVAAGALRVITRRRRGGGWPPGRRSRIQAGLI